MNNIDVTAEELNLIRSLDDFDLTMLLSEISANGWVHPQYKTVGGRALLPLIRNSIKNAS